MLSLVGRPVAVNPDSALRAEAKDRGWEIRDFRTGRKAAKIGIPAGARCRRGWRGGGRGYRCAPTSHQLTNGTGSQGSVNFASDPRRPRHACT